MRKQQDKSRWEVKKPTPPIHLSKRQQHSNTARILCIKRLELMTTWKPTDSSSCFCFITQKYPASNSLATHYSSRSVPLHKLTIDTSIAQHFVSQSSFSCEIPHARGKNKTKTKHPNNTHKSWQLATRKSSFLPLQVWTDFNTESKQLLQLLIAAFHNLIHNCSPKSPKKFRNIHTPPQKRETKMLKEREEFEMKTDTYPTITKN